MGFSSFMSDLAPDVLSNAAGWASDFMPVIGIVIGVGVFGAVFLTIKKFMQ